MRSSLLLVMCVSSAGCGAFILPCTDDADCAAGTCNPRGACVDPGTLGEVAAAGQFRDDDEPLPPRPRLQRDERAGAIDLPRSCLELRQAGQTENGRYVILDRAGRLLGVDCDMQTDGGGWTLIADTEHNGCPAGWLEAELGCDRFGLDDFDDQIASATFPIPVATFTEVRGEARAVAAGSNRGFFVFIKDLSLVYVDGLSLTLNDDSSGARAHLWTFAAGGELGPGACPCVDGAPPPAAVTGEYSCTSPAAGGALWDGRDDACGDTTPDFQRPTPATGDRVEARIMSPYTPAFGQSDRVFVTKLVIAVR